MRELTEKEYYVKFNFHNKYTENNSTYNSQNITQYLNAVCVHYKTPVHIKLWKQHQVLFWIKMVSANHCEITTNLARQQPILPSSWQLSWYLILTQDSL